MNNKKTVIKLKNVDTTLKFCNIDYHLQSLSTYLVNCILLNNFPNVLKYKKTTTRTELKINVFNKKKNVPTINIKLHNFHEHFATYSVVPQSLGAT